MSSASHGNAAALLAALILAACTGTSRAAGQVSPTPAVPAATSSASHTSHRSGNPADVYFMSGMIGHHAQALIMAGWAPSHGASASVRVLAERIVNEQNDEIRTMQQWLRDRGQPVPDARATGMRMVMNGVEHEMLMPGMLTPDQMKQLDAARGEQFDRLFLTFMIQHHRGAVSMVTELFATDGAAQEQSVFKLASDVNVDQTTEIDRMQTMLAPYLIEGRGR
jgi:uncharacterized protein (DUF305 family)